MSIASRNPLIRANLRFRLTLIHAAAKVNVSIGNAFTMSSFNLLSLNLLLSPSSRGWS
jgi:hypothetical protein